MKIIIDKREAKLIEKAFEDLVKIANTIIDFSQDKLVFKMAREINEINSKVANSLNSLNLKSLSNILFSLVIWFRIF